MRPWHRRLARWLMTVGVSLAMFASMINVAPASAASVPLSISVDGNHFINGYGNTIRLLGVNHTSAEYGCVDGFGYDDGHFDQADAAAIASWGADAVRIPLNEDCWLGINGQPNSNEGASPALTQNGYQQEIENYVADLNAQGIYAILDLHWSAPGTQIALEQQPMPDEDHSPAFWTSVASTFKNNPAVVFDLYNEPYDPTNPNSGPDQDSADKVSWDCWDTGTENGTINGPPCYTQAYDDSSNPTTKYQVAGLQTLVDAVRDTGADQPVLIGGLDYANDLGIGSKGQAWLQHRPTDPIRQEAASFHNYMGKPCDDATCWNDVIAPIAAKVPVVTGEFDEDNFDQANCSNTTPTTFDADYMNWADSAGVSYLAWGWIVLSQDEENSGGCGALYLIDNYTDYTPSQPNGVALYQHLQSLESAAKPRISLTQFSATVQSGNKTIGFKLRTAQSCSGALTGQTVNSYSIGKSKPRPVSLGSAVKFSLTDNAGKTVVLKLSTTARKLLESKGSLKVRITLTLTSSQNTRTVDQRTVTLKLR